MEEDFEPIFDSEEELDAFLAQCAKDKSDVCDNDFVPIIDSE